MDYFEQLGGHIEREWAAANRDEEQLPDIACEALSRFPPAACLHERVVEGLLGTKREPTSQLAPAGAFGEPGVTLYHGGDFVIDVYFWNNAVPAIHNHPFCGCFTILHGRSLHDVYDFEEQERPGGTISVGSIRPTSLTWLAPGAVVPFSLQRYPLIHSLVHVTNPAVSMVIRSVRTADYYRYLPPHLALAVDPNDDWLARQLQMLAWLRWSGDATYMDRLRDFLREADFETAVRTISAVFDPELNEGLIDIVRERHGDHADLILPSLTTSILQQTENEIRESYADEETRTVLSVMMCARNRADVFRLLSEADSDEDPSVLLKRLDVFEPEDETTHHAYIQLIDGNLDADVWHGTLFHSLTVVDG